LNLPLGKKIKSGMAEYLRSEYVGLDFLSAEGPENLKNLLEYSTGNIKIIINEE